VFSFLGFKAKMAAFGAALLAVLALVARLKIVKYQRDRAVVVAETLKARHHVQKEQKKIIKREEEKLHSRRVEIIKEIKQEKFKGVDNLSDSNDY
jgi:hypothetical protein